MAITVTRYNGSYSNTSSTDVLYTKPSGKVAKLIFNGHGGENGTRLGSSRLIVDGRNVVWSASAGYSYLFEVGGSLYSMNNSDSDFSNLENVMHYINGGSSDTVAPTGYIESIPQPMLVHSSVSVSLTNAYLDYDFTIIEEEI